MKLLQDDIKYATKDELRKLESYQSMIEYLESDWHIIEEKFLVLINREWIE